MLSEKRRGYNRIEEFKCTCSEWNHRDQDGPVRGVGQRQLQKLERFKSCAFETACPTLHQGLELPGEDRSDDRDLAALRNRSYRHTYTYTYNMSVLRMKVGSS